MSEVYGLLDPGPEVIILLLVIIIIVFVIYKAFKFWLLIQKKQLQAQQPPSYQPPQLNIKPDVDNILHQTTSLTIPTHIESNATGEIILSLKNITNQNITNISVDFTDLENFFDVKGIEDVPFLRQGMEIERRVKITPKEEKGTFPIIIKITGSGVTIEKEYTIKVGGTEIY